MYKKRVAFITPIYLPANIYGSNVFVKELAEWLVGDNFNVAVITSNALTGRYWYDPIFGKKIQNVSETINKVKVIRLKTNQILSSVSFILVRKFNYLLPKFLLNKLEILHNGPFLVGLSKALEKGNFDVIHVSPLPLNICFQIVDNLKNLSRKPRLVITPFYHTGLKEFSNPYIGKILHKYDLIHTVSDYEKKYIIDTFHIPSDKIKTIPLFLNLAELHSKENLSKEINQFRKEYNLKGKNIIFFAGNKGRYKGVLDLLKAVSLLNKKNKNFVLIAAGENSPEWLQATKTCQEKCLINLPYVRGKKKEALFSLADIYAMPSISESFGITYLEAWHKKKPVIAADIPSSKELIKRNNGGILIPYGNVGKIATAIEYLTNNKKVAAELGLNGYKALNEFYVFDKLYPLFKDIFI